MSTSTPDLDIYPARTMTQNAMSSGAVPNIPYLPNSPQTPQEWFSWSQQILLMRAEIILQTSKPGPAADAIWDREAERCRESRPYMIAMYGSIYEARPDEEKEDDDAGIMIPFIPFPFQIKFMYWYYERRSTKGRLGDGMAVKSRDMGLSNLSAFLVGGDWACEKVFQARVLSRTEDLVDATGDPDSLFWKIEKFIAGLPEPLFTRLVPGFTWKKHRMVMKFINPANGNSISGESTQANAGRGRRATVIIYDEAAFMPNFGAIWTAGRASTRHRIAISTVSTEEGLEFYNLHHGKGGYEQPSVIQIHYYEHPFHDDAWLATERERDTEEGIQREIFMNYHAGSSEWVYPETHEKRLGAYPFVPGGGHVYCTMDDGFDDDFAMVWIQFVRETGRFRVFQGYQNSHKVTDFYGSLLKGVPESNFGDAYGKTEFRIMMRQQDMPPMVYTVDTHFDNVEQMTGSSPYERFAEKYNIVAHMSFDPNKRKHSHRRLALGKLLPLMDFNEVDGGADVLEALQRYRFKATKEGRDQMTEYKRPLHDKYSHLVTALEWFAINWDDIKFSNMSDNMVYSGKPHK